MFDIYEFQMNSIWLNMNIIGRHDVFVLVVQRVERPLRARHSELQHPESARQQTRQHTQLAGVEQMLKLGKSSVDETLV